jgi:hypothetical protein
LIVADSQKIAEVKTPDTELKAVEFRKTISHSSLVTQQFENKFVPAELAVPNNPEYFSMGIDDNLIKSFLILRRWLGFPPTIENFNNDDSLPSKWLKD